MKVVQAAADHQLSVTDQALHWFVRLRSGEATIADQWQFQAWVNAEPSHRHEFEKLSRLWGDLDNTKSLFIEELNRVVVDEKQESHQSLARHKGRRISFRTSTAVAATFILFIAGSWWIASRPEVTDYRTAKGEQRTVALPDGSRIVLNTDTAVTTHLSSGRRAVILHRGEAFFFVSHDKKSTFEVEAGNGLIRDIGTQFTVRREPAQVTVIVVEGAVEVQSLFDSASSEPWRLLTAGDKASYNERGPLSSVEKTNVAASTAWIAGKVSFDLRPLADVIQEFGRYQNGEIRVLDSRLNGIKVSGVFAVNDREGFLKALESAVPAKLSRINDGLVILEQKEMPAQR